MAKKVCAGPGADRGPTASVGAAWPWSWVWLGLGPLGTVFAASTEEAVGLGWSQAQIILLPSTRHQPIKVRGRRGVWGWDVRLVGEAREVSERLRRARQGYRRLGKASPGSRMLRKT
jgi:hypothetical protein